MTEPRRPPVTLAVVGAGLRGNEHGSWALANPDRARVVAVCEPREVRRARFAARHDLPAGAALGDWRELADRGRAADAVLICTQDAMHVEPAIAFAELGYHVLLEKPMATTVEGCDRLLAAARASGRLLSIGHELRLSTQFGRVKALIDAGEIGAPTYASFSLFRFPFRPGSAGWRYDAARVGSWILEEPVHFFDFVMWYFESLGDPVSVQALGSPGGRAAGLTESFTALLRFAGGAHAVITQTLGGFEYHQLLHVVGTEGSIRSWWSGTLDRTLTPAFELRHERRGRGVATVPAGPSGELVELGEQARQVVAAFAERRPLLGGEEARKRIVVCLAAEESLRDGREVALRF